MSALGPDFRFTIYNSTGQTIAAGGIIVRYKGWKYANDASVTFEPSQVSISDDASVATTFSFTEPVYVKNGVEYCIVLQTDSNKYLAWIPVFDVKAPLFEQIIYFTTK